MIGFSAMRSKRTEVGTLPGLALAYPRRYAVAAKSPHLEAERGGMVDAC
jgi:hypothetical protein